MKQLFVVFLSLTLSEISGQCLIAHATDGPATQEKEVAVSDQLATDQPSPLCAGSPLPTQTASMAAQRTEGIENPQHAQAAPPSSSPPASFQHPGRGASKTVEPGEGYGCFYHQGRYSHLPLFKDGVYTLPGSHDVVEPYRKPLNSVLTPPSAPSR